MSYHEQDRFKKRKISDDGGFVDSSRRPSFFNPTGGRDWTVSVAIPGSVISTCRRDDQRIAVINQIARALAIFSVDEVVVFDDTPADQRARNIDPASYMGDVDPCGFVEQLLSYSEVPPFMRKALVPFHPNLKGAALLDNLEMPHHPNPVDLLPFREGITTSEGAKDATGSVVDVGAKHKITIDADIPPKHRVTVKIDPRDPSRGEAVHPETPRTEGGYYWGYSIRRSASLSAVFEESKFEGGYDLSIGTSERGSLLAEAFPEGKKKREPLQFKHLLIVFGGPRGLEYAAENDDALQEIGIIRGRTKELFDYWVNILPNQGSRSIRTQEALLIGLTALRRFWEER
ncbi:putative RNA methyltransferase [Xylariales sp. PMI_506]|nr:putative RNA methyltransferase [Xylariales sp. PMI_506]